MFVNYEPEPQKYVLFSYFCRLNSFHTKYTDK